MKGRGLLHVEDDDSIAFLLRAALDEIGASISVYRVSDGEQALAFLHRSGVYQQAAPPELILLDINLPKVDGWEVLQEIQRNEILRAIPVIVCSASPRREDRERALSAGARRYVVKPAKFSLWLDEVKLALTSFLPALPDPAFRVQP
ncbi:MAG TPA: response regulator [Bryobacteraceae bacterium]|nr:response regulator [Bryobacteraceae bacterium]